MRLKRNNERKTAKFSILLLGLILSGAGLASAIGQVTAATMAGTSASFKTRSLSSSEKNYDSHFSAEYSRGIIFRNPSSFTSLNHPWEIVPSAKAKKLKCPTNTKQSKLTDANYICGNNSKLDPDLYITFKNAAIYNNRWYDIREYDYIVSVANSTARADGAYWAIKRSSGSMASDQGSAKSKNAPAVIMRKIYLYDHETGKLEKNFKGIMSFGDFDWGETIKIMRGYNQAYLKSPTPFLSMTKTNTWTMSGGAGATNPYDTTYQLWVEVKPNADSGEITISYQMPILNRGEKNITSSTMVQYSLSGDVPASVKNSYRTYDIVANNGKYKPQNLPSVPEGYTIRGWCYDKNCNQQAKTEEVIDSRVSTSNLKLYGIVTGPETDETATINTSITNGDIDPSNNKVPAGESKTWTVSYDCNSGYQLESITVDEAAQDIAEHPDSYTFENIVADSTHNITVVCREGSSGTDEEDEDNDEDTIDITTEIENGTITDSEENLDEGSDFKVEYKCNEGYKLSTLIVDNEEEDITKYPSSYIFEDLTHSHTISAVCRNGDEKDIKTPNTGSINSTNYGADNTAGGSVNVGILALSALTTITGFAIVYRFIRHSKAMSFKK